MNEKNKQSIIEVLTVFSLARNKIVNDFKERERELFFPMFKYENHRELMKLSIENYFTLWVSFHFIIWMKHYQTEPSKLFIQSIKSLLLKDLNKSESSYFTADLISSKIKFIENLITKGEKDNDRYNGLMLEYEKDKTLFQREINKLKGDLK